MPALIDLIGKRFGRLTVLSRVANKGIRLVWSCQCDCGKTALAHGNDLRAGKHRSCGCLHREAVTRHGATKHGGWRTPEYQAWTNMISRCYNPKVPTYRYWGGRGITVCDQWRHSFETFLADVGYRPEPELSLDRIDVNGNYEPGNCRWVTQAEQNSNQRRRQPKTVHSV